MKNEQLELRKSPELLLIQESKAKQIEDTFLPMVKMLKEFESEFNEIIECAETGIDKALSIRARSARIGIAKIRTTTENVRKKEKEEYLRAGKAIDGVANLLKWAVVEKEEKLKDVEDYHERIEAERKAKLQFDRAEKLQPYIGDDYIKNLSDMEEEVFQAFFDKKKKDYEDRIEAEKKAEADRIAREKAEKIEQERIKKENELLKKQAEEHEAQLSKERAIREKIEKELKAKAEAAQKEREIEESNKQLELKKGDSDKVNDLINDLKAIKNKYTFKSNQNQKMYNDTSLLIDKVIDHISKCTKL